MFSYVGITLVVSLSSFLIHYYSTIEEYMDEIFHIPQAMQYCGGNFHDWDSNITTYPGLYLTSYGVMKAMNAILLGYHRIYCSTLFLRSMNILLSCTLPIIYYYCRLKITSDTLILDSVVNKHKEDAYFISCLLYLYPLSMFYYPLYYTDTISIVSISITYLLSLHHNTCSHHKNMTHLFSFTQHLLLLILVSWSILARQTNAVWILFIIGTLMLRVHKQLEKKYCDDDNDVKLNNIHKQLLRFLSFLWKNKGFLIVQTWSLLLPVIFFVFYVAYTGSIVVGHKSHHVPTLHLAMLSHALFLCTLIQIPLVLRNITQCILSTIIDKSKDKSSSATSNTVVFLYERLVQIPLLQWILYLSIVIISYVALVYYSFSHPFLESDNRHYMFYVWRRFLKYKRFRMIISPIYCSMVTATIIRLRSINDSLWILIYLLALAISLVPTPLLEPRYFTPGIVFFTVHSPIISNKPLVNYNHSNSSCSIENSSNSSHLLMVYVNILVFIIINAITMYVFINKTFTSSDGQIARFMY